ncbi:tyrosinase family protein [Reichenbachiella agariperforans]|uniref:tyrosinase family protein n=1 Tax=Reichenbachiella agariperforans TaxID=156994 RepID=UPI001C0977B5|nr:tyrosinase family protein [Reichenbachiella agariperforans]MBU2912563.1 tyrosinase family protein [Reichenbachiella agariperforans]
MTRTKTMNVHVYRLLLVGLLWVLSASLSHAQVIRKNIDSLSIEELAAYQHAIQLLRDRSADNPYLMDGYAWQAWVHNKNRVSVPKENTLSQGDQDPTAFYEMAATQTYADGSYGYPGMCEHGKDIFFVWHRAQFYYFEKVLQNTDPEGTIVDSRGNKCSTAKVGVPFWNFTNEPSGTKFPAIFEDSSSVLYHAGRNLQVNPDYRRFTSPYLLAKLMQESNWSTFGGYPNATHGGYGTFESQMHNPMHTPYIGGDMTYPSRAAYDPIFYSFHAYIDYIFEAWIQKHGSGDITSLDYFLRAEQPKDFNLPGYDPGLGDRPNMGRAELYLDISELGYQYLARGKDDFYTEQELEGLLKDKKGRPLVLGKSKESPYYRLFTSRVSWRPETKGQLTSETITIRAADVANPYSYSYTEKDPSSSYQIDLYMHPVKVKPNVSLKKFRKRYFVGAATAWLDSSHAHHMMGEHKLNVNLTEAMNALNQNHTGEAYQITVNYTKR